MRSGWIAALTVLATATASGRDIAPRYRLAVSFNMIEHVATPEALAGPCLTDRPVYGCTRFGARRLDCDCEKTADGWRMTARAQFIPFIYLAQKDLLLHEQKHIDDVRRDTVRYLDQLTATKFSSLIDCQAAATSASASFADQME